MCGGVYQNELKYDPETGEPLIDGYPLYSGLPKSTLADDGNTGVASEDESNTDVADRDEMQDLIEALGEAVYLLNPTDEDMQKKAGVYRVVTALEKLKEKIT